MRLDTWQVRVCVKALETAADMRRADQQRFRAANTKPPTGLDLERKALEAMAAALESGEALEVGT